MISDYFYDGHWHFDYDFFMKHTYIVRDIPSIHVSRDSNNRVWEWHTIFFALPILGLTSLLGFGAHLYPLVVRPSSGEPFGGNSPLLIGFVSLAFMALQFAFIIATRFCFGKQLGFLWRTAFITTLWSVWHARNKVVFDEIHPSIQRCLAFITTSIKETDQLALGHISGSVRELLIMGHLGLSGRPLCPLPQRLLDGNPLKLVGTKLMLMVVLPLLLVPSLQELFTATLADSSLQPSPGQWAGAIPCRLNWPRFSMPFFSPLIVGGTLYGWNLTPSWPFIRSRLGFR
ncbi:hypothetical protein ACS0TY_011053 [Phlomoides rotata]